MTKPYHEVVKENMSRDEYTRFAEEFKDGLDAEELIDDMYKIKKILTDGITIRAMVGNPDPRGVEAVRIISDYLPRDESE